MIKTLKIEIQCSKDTCAIDIYRQCIYMKTREGKRRCFIFNSDLDLKGYNHSTMGIFAEFHRCKPCKEAEI
jgi:hypothetical protein